MLVSPPVGVGHVHQPCWLGPCSDRWNSPSQDDEASFLQRNSGADTIHANFGFEASSSYPTHWGFWNHDTLDNAWLMRTTSHYGNYALGWKPKTPAGGIYQTVRYVPTLSDTLLTVRSSIRRQTTTGATTGALRVRISTRGVSYASGGTCGTYPIGGVDMDIISSTTAWTYGPSHYKNPPNSWVNYDFPAANVLLYYGTHHAWDVRVLLTSDFKDLGGNYREIGFDNTRVWTTP